MNKILRKRILTAVFLIIAVICLALFIVFFGQPLVAFVSDTTAFRRWVNEYGVLSRICFVGMVVLQVIAAAIPGEPFEIAAGYAFGVVEGTLLYMLGVVIGSLPVILLVRKYGRRLLLVFFSEKPASSHSHAGNGKKKC